MTTRRVRPLASAASTESTPPECTSTRREANARLVFGKSNAMRAGLSMVKGRGSGAGPLMCNFNCTCCPDNVCTSMDSSLFKSAACVLNVSADKAASTIARLAARILNLIILKFSLWPQSFNANEAGRSMYPPRPSGMISTRVILAPLMSVTFPSFCPR